MAKLYQQLKDYAQSDYYPYHMPGHKRQLYGEMPKQAMELDITEIDGFDNLHQSEGILLELQQKAARLYGAEESFYLVNGSTSGILSAISAAVPLNGHILMARNSHKSAYHAAYLRNLTVSYLYPETIEAYDICGAILPQQIREALEQETDVDAVFIVSPTYEGKIAEIAEIAEIVHAKGIPLIVDEAHGAHLGLAEGFAQNSCRLGADIVIHSVHKTLPAMTQTALLHVCGNRVRRDLLKRFLHIYQSSSPSYILMASIDNALQLVEEQGQRLFRDFRRNYLEMVQQLRVCRNMQFPDAGDRGQDIGKLVISVKRTGLSGQQIYDILLQKYHLQLEMAAGSYCLAMFTVGDSAEAYQRMTQALLEIDDAISKGELQGSCFESVIRKEMQKDEVCLINKEGTIPLSKSWDMAWETVPLEKAIGRSVAEFINLYPPGTPLLVPGEVLDWEQYQKINAYLQQKLTVLGVENAEPYLVKVIQDR